MFFFSPLDAIIPEQSLNLNKLSNLIELIIVVTCINIKVGLTKLNDDHKNSIQPLIHWGDRHWILENETD